MYRRNRSIGSAPRPLEAVELPDQAALLVQVRRLLAETQALSSRIAAINEVAVAINNSHSLDTILPVVADQAKWILDFDYCAVALTATASDHYTITCLFDSDPLPAETRVARDAGIIGRLLQTGQAQIIRDPRETADSAFGARAQERGFHSGLATPLVAGGRILGVFLLLSQQTNRYTLDDVRIAYLLGLQLAAALHNVQMLEREQRRAHQFQVLAEVGRETTGLSDLATSLDRVVEAVRQAFGYLRVNVATVDGNELIFKHIASYDAAEVGVVRRLRLEPDPQGISGWVVAHDTPLVIHDVRQDARYLPHPATGADDPVRTEYAVPIRSRERIIGVLDCQCGRSGAFDTDEQNLLQAVASQISAALEAQELYRRVNGLFQQYVSAPLAQSMLTHQTSTELGGARQEVTVLFADLNNFSSFAESAAPETLIETLQTYLGMATAAVLEYGGTPTQYLGDGLMALFNAPAPDRLHTWHALQAAKSLRRRVRDYNATTSGPQMQFAVGLHCGEAVVGNLGSASLRCYTAVGDTVNLAKRVQETADGGEVLFTAALYESLHGAAQAELLGEVVVKGRLAPVTMYRLPPRPARGTKRTGSAYAVGV